MEVVRGGEAPGAADSRESLVGSNNTSRAPTTTTTTVPGPSGGPGPGIEGRARHRAEVEAAADSRDLRDIVPSSAVPRPSREETVESRTVVSERVS